MQSLGHASLLLVPVYDGRRTIGILEFAHRTPRRWSTQDIAHAQGLAEHLSPVLQRLGVGCRGGRAFSRLIVRRRLAGVLARLSRNPSAMMP